VKLFQLFRAACDTQRDERRFIGDEGQAAQSNSEGPVLRVAAGNNTDAAGKIGVDAPEKILKESWILLFVYTVV
jgi:hypothetical protein